MENTMSPADVMAMMNNGNGANTWMNNPFVYLVFLWIFRMFNNNGENAAANGALTRAELYEGLNAQTLDRRMEGLGAELTSGFSGVNTNMLQGFNGLNVTNLNGFNQIQRDLCSGFGGVNGNITDIGYKIDSCCCTTNRNIDALKAENYKNTCEITNAIHGEGELTRALINQNTVQALRDKIDDKDRELQTANFRISQYAQNEYLIGALQPMPRPAYWVSSPYSSVNPCGVYNTTCGCGS